MMIEPEEYLEELENLSYKELIEERDGLIDYIQIYEMKEAKGDRSGSEWKMNPSPDVRYQMGLVYLSKLCAFMQEKYNREYIWGDKKFSDDE